MSVLNLWWNSSLYVFTKVVLVRVSERLEFRSTPGHGPYRATTVALPSGLPSSGYTGSLTKLSGLESLLVVWTLKRSVVTKRLDDGWIMCNCARPPRNAVGEPGTCGTVNHIGKILYGSYSEQCNSWQNFWRNWVWKCQQFHVTEIQGICHDLAFIRYEVGNQVVGTRERPWPRIF